MKKCLFTLAVLMAASSACLAEDSTPISAQGQLKLAAETSGPLAKAPEIPPKDTGPVAPAGGAVGIPAYPTDVLTKCDAIPPITPGETWTLDKAAKQVDACLKAEYPETGRSYTVTADVGSWNEACHSGGPIQPRVENNSNCLMHRNGIMIKVQGTILVGDGVLRDLQYSLKKRGSKLMGFPASLDSSGAKVGLAPRADSCNRYNYSQCLGASGCKWFDNKCVQR